MLKIKDNVDLKELEKFGFHESSTTYFIEWLDIEEIWVSKKTRAIAILGNFSNCAFCHSDILYDLIKADLVEKVDDK